MRKIVVPTDFSEQADNALELACDMAEHLPDVEITVIHVIEHTKKNTVFLGSSSLDTTGQWSKKPDMNDVFFIELYRKRRSQMQELMDNPRFTSLKIEDKIMRGNAYQAIEDEIVDTNADLIIMGTTGINDWEESLIGSTAEKVVRHASCPVLTLRKKISFDDISNIAFASDFSGINTPFLNIPKSIQEYFHAKLHFVFINTPSNFRNERDIRKIMSDYAKENNFDNYKLHIYSHFNEEEGIVSFIEDYDMDMVILSTHGRTGFIRLFEHSIAEDVVNYSKKPVLTFNLHNLKKREEKAAKLA
ncbi:MAG TPA: universal stress protein [Cytophagales bacterium]|jgi:nucleotide-binding universal stress UspA family protein|nr:universal stress protein [Cytophagales bacterium]